MARAKNSQNDTAANLGFEAKLWAAADALRNNMDAAEYKHVVLGLISRRPRELPSSRRVGVRGSSGTTCARLNMPAALPVWRAWNT